MRDKIIIKNRLERNIMCTTDIQYVYIEPLKYIFVWKYVIKRGFLD